MINFLMNNVAKKNASQILFTFCILTSGLLQSCGGDRAAPFNPASSSSSSSVASVDFSKIIDGTQTNKTIDNKEKNLQVLRDQDGFNKIFYNYYNANVDTPNFADGQVIIIDMGDTDVCTQHLNFSNISAQTTGTKTVKVVVNYTEQSAITSGCTPSTTRPYYVYYIKSRNPIVFSENISQ